MASSRKSIVIVRFCRVGLAAAPNVSPLYHQVSYREGTRWGQHVAIARPSGRAQGVTTKSGGMCDFTVKTVQKVADSYWALKGYAHDFVNHVKKEYARGDVHENRAECLFSLLKPLLRAFRGITKCNAWVSRFLPVSAQLSSADGV